MNKDRRRRLQTALDIVQQAFDEEQEAWENLPDNLLYSSKSDDMEENVNKLAAIVEELEEVINR